MGIQELGMNLMGWHKRERGRSRFFQQQAIARLRSRRSHYKSTWPALKITLYTFTIKYISLKDKGPSSQKSPLPNSCTAFCYSPSSGGHCINSGSVTEIRLMVHFCASRPNPTTADVTLLAWNLPRGDFIDKDTGQSYQLGLNLLFGCFSSSGVSKLSL